jgi:hypothetical protein
MWASTWARTSWTRSLSACTPAHSSRCSTSTSAWARRPRWASTSTTTGAGRRQTPRSPPSSRWAAGSVVVVVCGGVWCVERVTWCGDLRRCSAVLQPAHIGPSHVPLCAAAAVSAAHAAAGPLPIPPSLTTLGNPRHSDSHLPLASCHPSPNHLASRPSYPCTGSRTAPANAHRPLLTVAGVHRHRGPAAPQHASPQAKRPGNLRAHLLPGGERGLPRGGGGHRGQAC